MAPLGDNQDAKTTNGSGGLLSETAPMEKHPAPLTAGNMFSRLAGIGVLLLIVVVPSGETKRKKGESKAANQRFR